MAKLSQAGIDLILAHEGFSARPEWPGAYSGVTIGHGYDLGYMALDQFVVDWTPHLHTTHFSRLKACLGLTRVAAKNRIPALGDIPIPKPGAGAVFVERSLPQAETKTREALIGAEALCDDAYAAMVSLVFNRGASMHDPSKDPPALQRRREMRAIRDCLRDGSLSMPGRLREIAAQLRSMKRLWVGKGVDGLIRRREDEARLVERCLGP